jgi:hypothetical protein
MLMNLLLGTGHYLWLGGGPKRKWLGKQTFGHVEGWVEKIFGTEGVG